MTYIPGDQFMQVVITPAAYLERSRLVLLVWPLNMPIDKNVENGLQKAIKHPLSNFQGEVSQ